LLNLQAEYIRDEQALEMFIESQNRIKSMALVHEELYKSRNLAKFNFSEYVQNLTTYMLSSYGASATAISLKIKIKDVSLNIDKSVTCGLIINELISNSLKYAFSNRKRGMISIEGSAENDNKYTLIVSDNGIGFPKNLDFRATKTLGLQLICTLIDELNGTIDLESNGGTKFTIVFENINE